METIKTIIIILLMFVSLNVYSQDDRKTVQDLTYKTKLQGVWAKTPNGGTWIKVVITGDTYQYFTASPKDGKWSSMNTLHNSNNRITSFVKVTTRNDYDGKLITYNVAYTDNDKNGLYTAFYLDFDDGKQSLTLISKGDEPNYSPSTGKDLNSPFTVKGLIKRPSNFNPWSN